MATEAKTLESRLGQGEEAEEKTVVHGRFLSNKLRLDIIILLGERSKLDPNQPNRMLEIYTLGELSLKLDGQPLEFATRKVEALLYLACSRSPSPREVLAELLWQDRSQAQSQANFLGAQAQIQADQTDATQTLLKQSVL